MGPTALQRLPGPHCASVVHDLSHLFASLTEGAHPRGQSVPPFGAGTPTVCACTHTWRLCTTAQLPLKQSSGEAHVLWHALSAAIGPAYPDGHESVGAMRPFGKRTVSPPAIGATMSVFDAVTMTDVDADVVAVTEADAGAIAIAIAVVEADADAVTALGTEALGVSWVSGFDLHACNATSAIASAPIRPLIA